LLRDYNSRRKDKRTASRGKEFEPKNSIVVTAKEKKITIPKLKGFDKKRTSFLDGKK